MKQKIICVAAALFAAGCSTNGTASANPTDAQMVACRQAAANYWKKPSNSSYVNTTISNASGGFDVQLVTSDQFRTTCTIGADGSVTTRPGW